MAIVGAGVVGFKLLALDEPEAVFELPEQRAWLIETQQITKETLIPTVELFGRVVSPTHSRLTSILDAEVIEVNVMTGQTVEAGEVLIRLDSRTIQTQLRLLQADVARINASLEREHQRVIADREILRHENRLLKLATDAMERSRTLKNRNLISQSEFDVTERVEQQARLAVTAREAAIREYDSRAAVLKAELQRAQASLEKAMQDLEDAEIIAPYAGRITEVHVAAGNHVRNASPLVDMFDHTTTEIRTLIPNRYLAQVRKSITDEIELEAVAELDDEQLLLKLDRLASTVDPGRGGVDAYFRMSSNSIYPELGRSVTVLLSLSPVEDASAIPYQAVYGSNQVFKVNSDSLKSATIKRHGQLVRNNKTYIVATSSDLEADDLLVTTQLNNAVDGLKVEIFDSK